MRFDSKARMTMRESEDKKLNEATNNIKSKHALLYNKENECIELRKEYITL